MRAFNIPAGPNRLAGAPFGIALSILLLAVVFAGLAPVGAEEGDDLWAEGFEANGTDNDVLSLASAESLLYLGGIFTAACAEIDAWRVAVWNGVEMDTLASGMNGPVYALLAYEGGLIAGGDFSSAGGVPAQNVARWTGTNWEALGPGLGAPVRALAIHDGKVVAGGTFSERVAEWDAGTSSWVQVGSGAWSGPVYALSLFRAVGGDTVLVAGGAFTVAGGVAANYIARWNGVTWSQFGTGVTGGSVKALALSPLGTALAVGGEFTSVPGVAGTQHVAVYALGSWHALDQGVDGTVNALAYYSPNGSGHDIYAAGSFVQLGDGRAAVRIARWNGVVWQTVGTGLDDEGLALVPHGDDLVVGGKFETAGGIGAHHVALFDGSAWDNLDGNGMSNSVLALANFDPFLIAGGTFQAAGGTAASCVAAWDGLEWRSLGNGVGTSLQPDPLVGALVRFGDSLVVGGVFETAGTTPATNVAVWYANEWYPLGDGLEGGNSTVPAVAALAVHEGKLYAGGDFEQSGTTSIAHLAVWNGSAWQQVEDGLNGAVRALQTWGDHLIIGGDFTETGLGLSASHLISYAELVGFQTLDPQAALDGPVHALAAHDDTLFAGGAFTAAGGSPASYLVAYDYKNWRGLGPGPGDVVEALKVYNDSLVVAGRFTSAGGVSASRVARWNGSTWAPLGSGVDRRACALAEYQFDLFVGGDFTEAGGKASARIAEREEAQVTGVPDGLPPARPVLVLHPPCPNPTVRGARVSFELGEEGPARLRVHDVRGRLVRTLLDRRLDPGPHDVDWDGRDARGLLLARGIYFFQLETPGGKRTAKLVLSGGGR